MSVINLVWMGILVGLGVAIPIGPVNVEIIRRNIYAGLSNGIAIACGATLADTTYILLTLTGILLFFKQPLLLSLIGMLGSLILAWFAYGSFTAGHLKIKKNAIKQPFLRVWLAGYFITLLSPMSILFWLSMGTQIATLANHNQAATWALPLGVIIGTLSWSMSLNFILHKTRHQISDRVLHRLNQLGGIILATFAMIGFIHSIEIILK